MSSQSLKIGLDFDDVLVGTAKCTIDIYNKEHDAGLTCGNWYNFDPISGWEVDTLQEASDRVVSILRSDDFVDSVEPIDGAQKSLQHLKAMGCSLFIITGRSESIRIQTIKVINKHFPSLFDESSLYFTDYFEKDGKKLSKSDIVNNLGIDYFIDDQIDHVNDIAKTGIKTILFSGNYAWNKKGCDDGIVKCLGWREIDEYIGESLVS